MSQCRLSVIVPIYNVAPYLQQCLDSICVPTGEDNVEVILVNDGSTDHSLSIAQTWCERMRHSTLSVHPMVVSQPNAGLSAARNTGLRAATGEYVFFLDSDDWLATNAIFSLLAELNGFHGDILAFAGQNFDEETQMLMPADQIPEGTYATGYDYYCCFALTNRQFPFECVVLRLYRRVFLLQHNLLFGVGLYHEDNLFTPEVCYKAGEVKEISHIIYIYRRRVGSISTTIGEKHAKDIITIANRLAQETRELPFADKKVAFQKIAHLYQRPFMSVGFIQGYRLRHRIDFSLYYTVSRTKLRHRVNYLMIRYVPWLFRWIYA